MSSYIPNLAKTAGTKYVGMYYNGLLQTQHVIVALKNSELPLHATQIWDRVKSVSGIKSKTHMKVISFSLRSGSVSVLITQPPEITSVFEARASSENFSRSLFETRFCV